VILLRYFTREIFFTMSAVAIVVLTIAVGWRFSGYLESAAAGRMSHEVLLVIMAYRLPGFLEVIIPISFFLSIMLVHGRFHVDSEIIILRACGVSTGRLIQITLFAAMIVMMITGLISLWLKPMGEKQVEILLSDQKNLTEFDTLMPGRFQMLTSGKRVTYIESILADGGLERVFINEYDETSINGPRQAVTVIAETGRTQVDELGRRFLVLENGFRYEGEPGQKNFQIVEYKEYGQLVDSGGRVKEKRRRTAIPTLELFKASDSTSLSELHWRVGVVFMIPVIALLAIPLAHVKPRQGRFTRLVPAMILCFLYIVALSAARTGLEKGDIPLVIGLWWVHGLALFMTFFMYRLDWLSNKIEDLRALHSS
jgi:lipopolysaccharide export system permease protein